MHVHRIMQPSNPNKTHHGDPIIQLRPVSPSPARVSTSGSTVRGVGLGQTPSTSTDELWGTTVYSSSGSGSNSMRAVNTMWMRRVRKYIVKRGRWSIAFVLWTVLTGCVEIALVAWQVAQCEGYFTVHENVLNAGTITAAVYAMYLTFSAIRNENIFEIWGAIIFSAIVFGATIASATAVTDIHKILRSAKPTSFPVDPQVWYARYLSGIQDEMSDLNVWSQSIDAYQIVTCVVCGIHLLGQLAMLRWVWFDIKWNAFKKIGADRALQWRYSAFTILTVEIKVSIYFALLGGFYLGSHGLRSYTAPFLYASTTIYAVYAVSLLALLWASRKEYLAPVLAFLVVVVAFEVILVMQLSQLWPISPSFVQDTFFLVREVGTFFCVFNIFIAATVVATGALCAYNFGRGLRNFVDPSYGASSIGKSDTAGAKSDHGAEQDTRNVWALE